MSTPTRAILTTGVCVRGITIVVQLRILSTNFTVLAMREFGAIFSMVWMTRHLAHIDCQKKKVHI